MRTILALLFLSTAAISAMPQEEFVVNSYQDSTQRDPQIARDATGDYVVVWTSEAQESLHSEGDIYLQRFDPLDERVGAQIRVNARADGDQEKPAVAMSRTDDFVVAWASRTSLDSVYDIYAQRFVEGQPQGANFLVNTTVAYSQTSPDVAMKDDGSFVIVWESWFQDGSDRAVVAQRFNTTGESVGPEFIVNKTTSYSQARPAVAYTLDGGFVVVWESWSQTPPGYDLYGQRFDADGQRAGDEFQVNTYVPDYQWLGDVEGLSDGGFVVAWCSWEQDGDDGGVYLRRYDSEGNRVGEETRVNQTVLHYQWLPKIARLAGDRFVVLWSSWKQDGSREGVYAQLFAGDGTKLSLETRVNMTTESFQWEPAVVGTGENEFVAVWSSWGQTGKDYEVVARRTTTAVPQGFVKADAVQALSGRTTSKIHVHVIDATALTGDTYELTFHPQSQTSASAEIVDLSSSETVVSDLALSSGSAVSYLTPIFDGVAVEIVPEFELKLDTEGAIFANHSGSNLTFQITQILDSRRNIAPVDLALIWGSSDTLSDGRYAAPLDTAFAWNGPREVATPFIAWSLTDRRRVDLMVVENSTTKNQRWDARELIVVLTPAGYRTSDTDIHALVRPNAPYSDIALPGIGDTLYVPTKRPITAADTIRFDTRQESVFTGVETAHAGVPRRFRLEQNYPNPFNPVTTIEYSLPRGGWTSLRVYNVLGQQVVSLVHAFREEGVHRVALNASSMPSGVYFYTLEQGRLRVSRKMLLMR